MHVRRLTLENIRCFDRKVALEFSPTINLLVGPNSSGKSTLIWALSLLQPDGANPDFGAILSGRRNPSADVVASFSFGGLDGSTVRIPDILRHKNYRPEIEIRGSPGGGFRPQFSLNSQAEGSFDQSGSAIAFANAEPHNLFHFFLSRRKTTAFDQTVNAQTTNAVRKNFQHIHAKVAKLSLAQNKKHTVFARYVESVLRFELTSNMTAAGQQSSLLLADGEPIPLEAMGEGAANIVAFFADLAVAEKKVFLIEEPENDIHPSALIAMLEAIKEKSANNQFIISMHSNIVVSRLGVAEGTKVFALSMELKDGVPTSSVEELAPTAEARFGLMRSLGYDLSDMSLADGYILFEEASAESIVREILIPFVVPQLIGKIQTHSSGGIGNVKKRYEALFNLFVFLHTAPVYRNRSWVRVDAGVVGDEVVSQLRGKFTDPENIKFRAYGQDNFEHFYPRVFADRVTVTLAIEDKAERREAKRQLCKDVLLWAGEDRERARVGFLESAGEVITDLQNIAQRIA